MSIRQAWYYTIYDTEFNYQHKNGLDQECVFILQ